MYNTHRLLWLPRKEASTPATVIWRVALRGGWHGRWLLGDCSGSSNGRRLRRLCRLPGRPFLALLHEPDLD